jgi:hypothetical protein
VPHQRDAVKLFYPIWLFLEVRGQLLLLELHDQDDEDELLLELLLELELLL